MSIPIINSRELVNTWRILDDKLGVHRERGLPFRFSYVGSFSQQLAEYFVRIYSNPGDTVLDPFSGRGSVAMQALWHDRHMICNDLSPYSNTLCHSVLWTPYMKDVNDYLKMLEEYILGGECKISEDYPGKGSKDDVARLYHQDTFQQIIRLRNLLNYRSVLLGRGYNNPQLGIEAFITELKDGSNGSKNIIEAHREYDHEVVMFIRMMMTQSMLSSNLETSFNGIKIRGTDSTNVRSLLRYFENMGETPQYVNIFDQMRSYIEKMDLDNLGVRNRFNKLNRNMIACDARGLSLPDRCVDLVVTSPPYTDVLNYGMANWIKLFILDNIGDPLVRNSLMRRVENAHTSEIHGKLYDKITDSTGSTVANTMNYSSFTGQYIRELYRVLKDDACAIIVVGDYGSKRKLEAWRLVSDRAAIFGFKPVLVIMDELNKDTKSSSQFQSKYDGGKNDYDVVVVLYKGLYERKNDPEKVDFRWGAKFADSRQKNIIDAWSM